MFHFVPDQPGFLLPPWQGRLTVWSLRFTSPGGLRSGPTDWCLRRRPVPFRPGQFPLQPLSVSLNVSCRGVPRQKASRPRFRRRRRDILCEQSHDAADVQFGAFPACESVRLGCKLNYRLNCQVILAGASSDFLRSQKRCNRIFALQPNQLETLDGLLAQAAHYADYCLRNSGRMPPTLFLIGADGPILFMPENLADDSDKDAFATTARLMCIAHAATACVMALEAWAKFAKPGEKFDMTERPSEAFNRREFVILMGEDRVGQKQKFLPIIRSDNGKFFTFGESEVPEMDKMTGRFAQILPAKVADEQTREVAKVMLKVKGVNVAKPGTTVRLPRPRR